MSAITCAWYIETQHTVHDYRLSPGPSRPPATAAGPDAGAMGGANAANRPTKDCATAAEY